MAHIFQWHERRSPSHNERETVCFSQAEILTPRQAAICAKHSLASGER
jgi:hypothetical protein